MANKAPEIQYWDSCLFINFLTKQEPDKAETVSQLIVDAKASRLTIVLSNLVLAEVRQSASYDEESLAIIDELFDTDRPYIRFVGVTRLIGIEARKLGSQVSALSVPDTIHIVTAIQAEAETFLTYDGDRENKARRSGDLLKYSEQFGDPPLKIEVPSVDYGYPLLDERRS